MNETIKVTTQSTSLRGKAERWGYVLHLPGCWPMASAFRYRSEKAAREAGLVALAVLAFPDDAA